MPFELGIDFGAKHLGGTVTRNKKLLILERDKYRYLVLISDIAGQDIQGHSNDPDKAITVVRHWLRTVSRRATIPAAPEIKRRFIEFTSALPKLARDSGADPSDLQFVEYVKLAEVWLTTNPLKSV